MCDELTAKAADRSRRPGGPASPPATAVLDLASILPPGRNAAQWGFHPTRNPSTGRCKVPPPVPLSPAMPARTRISARMKPPMGRDSPVNIQRRR